MRHAARHLQPITAAAGPPSRYQRPRLLGLAVMGTLFALPFLLGSGVKEVERSQLILNSVVQFSVIALGFLILLMHGSVRGRLFRVERRDRRTFLWMGAWVFLALGAALVGLIHEHNRNYVVGDFYKFASLSILLALFYFAVREEATLERLLRAFVLLFAVFLTYDIVRYRAVVLGGERLTTDTTHYAGFIAPVVIYLLLAEKRRGWKALWVGVLLEMLLLLIPAQSLRGFVFLLVPLALFFLPARRAMVVVSLVLALGAFSLGVFYADAVLSTIPEYLRAKFELALVAPTPAEAMEALSGSRLAEVRYVLGEMATHPERIPFGFGLGGEVELEAIGGLPVYWSGLRHHYIHSGLAEILYRSGAVGLAVFCLLLGHLFRRAYRLYAVRGHFFGVFVMVNLVSQFLLLSIDAAFTSPLPLLGISFAGVSLLEGSHPARVEEGRHRAAWRRHRSLQVGEANV